MHLSEQQFYAIVDRVCHEGDALLDNAPMEQIPVAAPEAWRRILSAADPREAALELWSPVRDRFPRVWRALGERLHGVALLRTEDCPASLLYFFRDGDYVFIYRGGAPLDEWQWTNLPGSDAWRDFYRIHDGWTLFFSEDDGPAPRGAIRTMAEWMPEEAGFSTPAGSPARDDLRAVFWDQREIALAVEANAADAPALACTGDGSVEPLLDLCAEVDRRIGGFFAELDPVRRGEGIAPSMLAAADDAAAARYDRILARYERERGNTGARVGAMWHEQACDIALQRAWIELRRGGPEARVSELLRGALESWCIAIERCEAVEPDELNAMFGLAQHLADSATMAFIATLPRNLWRDDSPLAVASAVLFDLYLADGPLVKLQTEQLDGVTIDPATAALPYVRAVVALGFALGRGNIEDYRAARQRVMDEQPPGPTDFLADFPWAIRIKAFDTVAEQMSG